MKKTTLYAILMSAATLALADNPSVGGKWQVHYSIAGNDRDQDCTFTQKEEDLTGSCTSDKGSVDITGKVNGKKITWAFKSEYNGSPLTVNFEGTLDSSKITGSVEVPEFGVGGDFTATQSK